MTDILLLDLKYFTGFMLVAIAGYQIALFLQKKYKFPLITGLILIGILAGNSLLKYIPDDAVKKLDFIIDLSLAIIAFSAGAELHISEMRSRIKSINRMVWSQLPVTFLLTTLFIYLMADRIYFMQHLGTMQRLAVAALFGSIFIARSPSSAIAIINEMRARGPFTKTVLGTTIVMDVLVIVLFAITFSIAKTVVNGHPLDAVFFMLLLFEILISLLIGLFFGMLLKAILSLKLSFYLKTALVLLTGYGIYFFSEELSAFTARIFKHPFETEPLLMAIVASFYVVNYTRYRSEFEEILEEVIPYILILFFTLTGAGLSIQTLIKVFLLALILFILRAITLIIGSSIGVIWAKDPRRYIPVAWMPYMTQAGVAIGLAALVGETFGHWGHEFETIIIAIIVLSQILGPPLFKFSLNFVHEAHKKPKVFREDKGKAAVIFSYDNISLALAKSLIKKGWQVKIVTTQKDFENSDIPIVHIEEYSPVYLKKLNLNNIDAFILLHPEDRINLKIAEWLYENTDPKQIIASVRSAQYINEFKKLNVRTIEPVSALVSMLEHSVRSPVAMEILLNEEDGHDTVDVEVRNKDLAGLHIRDLKLPHDIIILSLKRRNNTVMTHGYTRLRLGDILTIVGPPESLKQVMLKFEEQ